MCLRYVDKLYIIISLKFLLYLADTYIISIDADRRKPLGSHECAKTRQRRTRACRTDGENEFFPRAYAK